MNLECPYCKVVNNTHSCLSEANVQISPGDFTLCIHCLKVSKMSNESNLEELTEEDIEELRSDTENWNIMQEAIRHIKIKRSHG